MADIKTRKVDRTSIKKVDHSIAASQRIRDAAPRSGGREEQGNRAVKKAALNTQRSGSRKACREEDMQQKKASPIQDPHWQER